MTQTKGGQPTHGCAKEMPNLPEQSSHWRTSMVRPSRRCIHATARSRVDPSCIRFVTDPAVDRCVTITPYPPDGEHKATIRTKDGQARVNAAPRRRTKRLDEGRTSQSQRRSKAKETERCNESGEEHSESRCKRQTTEQTQNRRCIPKTLTTLLPPGSKILHQAHYL